MRLSKVDEIMRKHMEENYRIVFVGGEPVWIAKEVYDSMVATRDNLEKAFKENGFVAEPVKP